MVPFVQIWQGWCAELTCFKNSSGRCGSIWPTACTLSWPETATVWYLLHVQRWHENSCNKVVTSVRTWFFSVRDGQAGHAVRQMSELSQWLRRETVIYIHCQITQLCRYVFLSSTWTCNLLFWLTYVHAISYTFVKQRIMTMNYFYSAHVKCRKPLVCFSEWFQFTDKAVLSKWYGISLVTGDHMLKVTAQGWQTLVVGSLAELDIEILHKAGSINGMHQNTTGSRQKQWNTFCYTLWQWRTRLAPPGPKFL